MACSIPSHSTLRLLNVVIVGLAILREGDAADPVLDITFRQREVVLTWPVSEERYYVESAQGLPGGWTFLAEPVVETDGSQQLRITPAADSSFFRLHAPLLFTSVADGGALYDNWWQATGEVAPETDHPLWASRPDTSSNTRTGAVTWRCKECHGWDYKGVDGAYASGSHRTGIRGIFGTQLTAPEIFDLVKNGHSYGAAGLTDVDVWNLAKFVLDGQIDTDAIIDAGGLFTGDSVKGESLYLQGMGTNESCATCHGSDGLVAPPGAPDFVDYPGLVATENPWEFQHKVRFGQPGTRMLGSVAGDASLQDVADLAAYVQSLPKEP